MKSILFFISLFIAYSSFSQSSLRFESRKVYLGEIEINNAYGINFSYENVSEKPIMLSYEPITNLVNTNLKPRFQVYEFTVVHSQYRFTFERQ